MCMLHVSMYMFVFTSIILQAKNNCNCMKRDQTNVMYIGSCEAAYYKHVTMAMSVNSITAYLTWISRGGPTSTFMLLVSGDVCPGMSDVESYYEEIHAHNIVQLSKPCVP